MASTLYAVGDWVIYRKTKHSPVPGPRAENVLPARNGDDYCYTVDKFWVVTEVRSDQQLVLKTRRGKAHTVSPDDPNLRKANWWERRRYRNRFELLQVEPQSETAFQQQSKVQAAT